jgi:hypothetical protein
MRMVYSSVPAVVVTVRGRWQIKEDDVAGRAINARMESGCFKTISAI